MYIILGKTGYIAEAMIKELNSRGLENKAISRSEINYLDPIELKYYLITQAESSNSAFKRENVKIINCAGYIGKPNVDACESHKAECIDGNVVFPAMLSQLCASEGYSLAHISSGCIYGGYSKDFSEADDPNFDFINGSFYSGTKALAEKIVLRNKEDSYVFRLRIPFDEYESPRNYLTKLLTYDNLLDVENSLSHRSDFAKYCINLMEAEVPFGIYNVTNKGSATTKQVVDLINKYSSNKRHFKFFKDLESFSRITVAPRSNCVLDTSNIESYIPIRTAEEALEEAVSKYFMPS